MTSRGEGRSRPPRCRLQNRPAACPTPVVDDPGSARTRVAVAAIPTEGDSPSRGFDVGVTGAQSRLRGRRGGFA
ncbi:hypothetical protein WS71_07045 [Burkholderia mayonis]|uniref:Uncharacterized protein n=1 Tax=Burkholderia mayonis TaxID=1385591 RepID=A0A1B4FTW6_9BURK|nr:hypothetical protein WS71_07045 [Burkholderia mayonis]KVE45977.1 hypothetical protein WS71_23170 [Burkholderia mayonis]